jgi:nicotinamide riboside transporter PnuC
MTKIMTDVVAQVGLAVFGVAAMALVASKNKWGFVIGLISEPFWLYTSYVGHQWGIFFLSVVYTFSWAWGIYVWFYRDNPEKSKV